MPASLETRRRAVADALRRVAAEALPPAVAGPPADAVVQQRLDALDARVRAVETVLLEDAWERPAAAATSADSSDEDLDERVSVPAVPLGEGRLSSVASQALFGH